MSPKVVLVTGANGAIGSATAKKFAGENYSVMINYNIEDGKIDSMVKDYGMTKFKASVRKIDEVESMTKNIIKQHGRIDVLINNAGITKDKTFLKMTDEEWDDVIQTNLYGTRNVTKSVLPYMKNQGEGSIVNVSSVVAISGAFGQTNYAASKAALIGFTKSLAKETARYNVKVNAVAPGYTESNMTAKIPEEVRKKITENIPFGRFATADEMADAIYYVSKIPYMTGEVVKIDGGL